MDNRHSAHDFFALADGGAQAVFMWWDLKMDVEGDVWIDMAPNNVESPTAKQLLAECDLEDLNRRKELLRPRPWRDHWMQAIYFFARETPVTKGEKSTLVARHDEYSLSFDVKGLADADAGVIPASSISPAILSRSKLGFINCESTRQKMISCLEKFVTNETTVCCIGEGSILPVICAALGAEKVRYVRGLLPSDWVVYT